MSITALIHTRNEAVNLPGCLESVDWADEIVVADMASTDGTRDIAISKGARLLDVPIAPIVEPVRDLAINQCRHEWVMIVDADERVSPGLAHRLRELQQTKEIVAFGIPRRNYFLGEWLKYGCWPDHQTRFVRRGFIIWPELVHEHPKVNGKIEYLPANPEEALEHPGYAPDLGKFMEKYFRYSRLDAERLTAQSKPEVWPYLIRRPLGEFYGRFFKAQAWRLGMHGLMWSFIMGMYQLQVAMHYWDMHRATSPSPSAKRLRRQVRWEAVRANFKWLRS